MESVGDVMRKILEPFQVLWWTRKWVLQEIALSRSVLAVWGACEISWYWIGLVAAIAVTQESEHRPAMMDMLFYEPAVSHAYLMLRLSRWGRLEPANLSFLHLLRLSMGFKPVILAIPSSHCWASKQKITTRQRILCCNQNIS